MVIKERSPSTFGVNNKVVNGVFNPDVMKQTYDMMVAIESLKGTFYFCPSLKYDNFLESILLLFLYLGNYIINKSSNLQELVMVPSTAYFKFV